MEEMPYLGFCIAMEWMEGRTIYAFFKTPFHTFLLISYCKTGESQIRE